MHVLHFISLAGASLIWSALFDIALVSAALLGDGWWVRDPPHKVYPPSGGAGFSPGIFSFTRCVVRHLGYFISMSSKLCPIWEPLESELFLHTRCLVVTRSSIEGYPFDCTVFLTFSEGYLKWSDEIDVSLRATWSWGYVPIFSEVSLLLMGCLVHSASIEWQISCWIILVSWFPSDKRVSKSFGGTASLVSGVPGIILPAFCSRRPLIIRSRGAILTSLQQAIFYVYIITLILHPLWCHFFMIVISLQCYQWER